MKKYLAMSSTLIVAVIVVLNATVFSQRKSSKTDAFHASLKQETAQEYAKSIQTLDAIYNDNKDDYLLNLRLGWLHYLAKSYNESKKFYGNAVALSGNKSIEAMLARTLPLAALNDWDGVVSTYNAILKLDPMNYTANLRLGQIYLNRAAYGEAKNYLQKAHVNFPGSYEPNLSLGWTYYYLGDKKNAEILLTNALMLSPGDTLALEGLKLVR